MNNEYLEKYLKDIKECKNDNEIMYVLACIGLDSVHDSKLANSCDSYINKYEKDNHE
jgi:hypothetical protein